MDKEKEIEMIKKKLKNIDISDIKYHEDRIDMLNMELNAWQEQPDSSVKDRRIKELKESIKANETYLTEYSVEYDVFKQRLKTLEGTK